MNAFDKVKQHENKYQKKGIFFILLGRHVLGLRAQIFLVSGVMRMHPLKFLLTDAIAVTVTIAVMVSIGYVGGHSLKDIGIDTSMIKYVVLFLLITIFLSVQIYNTMLVFNPSFKCHLNVIYRFYKGF